MSNSPHFTGLPSPFDRDQATLSNYLDVKTLNLHLDWTIDWESQTFGGSCTLTLKAVKDLELVILDASHLDIDSVQVDSKDAEWELGTRIGLMGEGLFVTLPTSIKAGQTFEVLVKYSTTKECTAVGWLTPAQTKSGKYPYLYSQCQAIHARSMFPCQDTPAIKATYSSKVRSILPVLMSALRVSPPSEEALVMGEEREYEYVQPVAIPSYLVAIASGELVYKSFEKIGGRKWRTGCWTEPGMMDACFWEFKEDTANFVKTAEDLTTPYQFGVYDILFLPESFPYGGMENCCLTFATPTIVAGDRSCVDVCAHEISHSWFGNGIGCASWSHFWLNEGWTTYLERLIMRETHGEAERQLWRRVDLSLGRKALRQDLEMFEPRFQRLVAEYKPHEVTDEGYNQVSYEKGSNFLLYLERTVGGLDHFIPYMKDYVKTFSGTSITTEQWRAHLFHYFGNQPDSSRYLKALGKVDWDAWLHGDGKDLCVDVEYDDSLSRPPLELADRWDKARSNSSLSQFSMSDISGMSPTQKIVFLNKLEEKEPLSVKAAQTLGKVYEMEKTGSAEIRLRFYQIVLKGGKEYCQDAAGEFGDFSLIPS
ncbi:leukotriene A-4 hydrolase/aminopeptidase [Tremella mesenterica]|uniref:Leukotriene A-4 hydrolase/aminopeptidase n=1 Tax=Tremella mesenterica TaxID=5217 RepID=A0A4Q1BKD7_TREME|nr:leukotriene A-4 hydrolase/aminopeptidase [Tremella mesenterica]